LQGAGEELEQGVSKYIERAPEPATQQFAKKAGGVAGSAGKQVSLLGGF